MNRIFGSSPEGQADPRRAWNRHGVLAGLETAMFWRARDVSFAAKPLLSQSREYPEDQFGFGVHHRGLVDASAATREIPAPAMHRPTLFKTSRARSAALQRDYL